ncbi:MAG: ATP-dependent RecD-like DNA helicase [Planctomycetota bacterium]|nr:MAG: ATP-dependent RecD-like DNA helicase [Planctomycetota bacterium]
MDELLPFTDEPPQGDGPARVRLLGTLASITFRNDDNGWTVARLETDESGERVTLVGAMPGVEEGDSVAVEGRWTQHPNFGRQLSVETCRVQLPSGRKGVVRFLGGGRIKGVGPATADKIVDALGLDVLSRLERNPELLHTVPGIGRAKAGAILEQLAEQRDSSDALVFLADLGLGPALSLRVWRLYKTDTVAMVRTDPFRLAEEVPGVGFRTADNLARELGHEPDSAYRVAAGLLHLLSQAALEGHVGLPSEELLERSAAFLEVNEQRVEQVFVETLEAGRLTEDELVYRPELLAAERDVAAAAARLLTRGRPPTDLAPAAAVARASSRLGFELADDQRAALELAIAAPLSVITGGPGVGKTTLVRAVVEVLEEQGCRLALAAPTGRAARRLAQATGRDAATLHRLLGLRPSGDFTPFMPQEQLDADVLVIDEVSMVDVTLMAVTLAALPETCAVVLVGDVDQLPSVGPGDVLAAFARSGVVPVARLTTVFRQAEGSGIVRVAHDWNAGRAPEFDVGDSGQAYWIERRDAASALQTLLTMATERIPQRFSLDPLRDVQVLTPMHKGPLGTVALNEALRARLNPPGKQKAELQRFGRTLREGDKVMQVKNNYDLDVFNGDVGVLTSIDEDASQACVDFEGRHVTYGLDQLDQLEPAFAITCHKSQGSEFPAVVLPLVMGQRMMLRRNLVYTAFTRAKQVLVALGETAALQRALSTVDTGTRHGRLAQRLAAAAGVEQDGPDGVVDPASEGLA